MKIFIVDTNIVFSAIAYPERRIGTFLLGESRGKAEFLAPTFLLHELQAKLPKLRDFLKISEEDLQSLVEIVLKRIDFIADDQIPFEFYFKSLKLIRDIDTDDLAFVSLTEYMDALLWTGDKRLELGLKAKGYEKVLNFKEVRELLKQVL